MTLKRDPRMNPKPGDVLKRGNRKRIVAELIHNGFGGYSCLRVAEDKALDRYPTFHQWRQWAATAEVVYRAEYTAVAK